MARKTSSTQDQRYKFQTLKIYNSTEWMADSRKKYRQVFDKSELSYLYVELCFINKLFEQKEWEVNINFKCYKFTDIGKDQLCNLDIKKIISQQDHTMYVREGWGNEKKGKFWHRGDYIWEAYADEIKVGEIYFYVEDAGPVLNHANPFFEILSLKLFEGASTGVPKQDRIYLSSFNMHSTRFVWVELQLENIQTDLWYCELMFNFYNNSGLLKGRTTELKKIQTTESKITVITGWGADTPGTWYEGKYTLEIVFMDTLVAAIPFQCDTKAVVGVNKMLLGEDLEIKTYQLYYEQEKKEPPEDIMVRLNKMVGLQPVKKQAENYLNYLKFLQIRQKYGFDKAEKIGLHTVFKGSPGTGKTTVAKLLARIFYAMGFLERNIFIEASRAELVGQYIGQTAPKVKEVIDSARGGVLFIDEAYALVRNKNDDKDYGHEAVEVLLKEMSDGPGDVAIFLAGYPAGMELLMSSNPGLKSRIKLIFDFPDYLPQELYKIMLLEAEKQEVTLDEQAAAFLHLKITDAYRNRDESFGNARMVSNYITQAKINMGLRVVKIIDEKKSQRNAEAKVDSYSKPFKELKITNTRAKADLKAEQVLLQTIIIEDVKELDKEYRSALPEIAIDEAALTETMQELNGLIGLEKIKKEINETISLVRYYHENQVEILQKFSAHTVFKGNPGTGKTTVARILAKAYRAMGVLERGHLIECSRENLVAGYVGQTATKTKKLIDRARGGVLFIDEAYALHTFDEHYDFGKESVEVLLKEMEENRGDLLVIVAGYTNPMDKFLDMNPGLKSRFDRQLIFEDFKETQLMKITDYMLEKDGLVLAKRAQSHIKQYLQYLFAHRDKHFGNARVLRKMVAKIVRNQHLRMANTPKTLHKNYSLKTVSLADVKEFVSGSNDLDTKSGVGFDMNLV